MLILEPAKIRVTASFIVLFAMMLSSISFAQEVLLGKIDFPTSGAQEAQPVFIRTSLWPIGAKR